jgi:phenylacetate-CoA ligase
MIESLIKFYYFLEARKLQKLPRREIEKIKNKKLRAIVSYAYRYVPAYRRLWKERKIDIERIKSEEDLKKLPIIDKKIVKANYDDFLSVEYFSLVKKLDKTAIFFRQTSGTTGKPLELPFDINSKIYLDAVYARALIDVGYNYTKPLLYYWWSMRENKWYARTFGLFKKDFVPIEWNEIQQLKYMQKTKPKYIYYYPSQLFFIAKYILKYNIKLNFKPKLIITHAEILTENMRRVIEEAFNAPVFDEYGSNEFNRIAFECLKRDGYHIPIDALILEILDEDGKEVEKGETGEIVITSLVNRALPLIRYRQEDYVVKSEEEFHNCGINLPIKIKSIEGRKDHSINKRITQKKLIETLVDCCEDFWKFQLFFNEKKNATLYIVPWDDSPEEPNLNELKRFFRKIEIIKVENIKKNKKTGKTILVEKVS